MSVTGPAGGEPTKVGVPVIDLLTGLYAVIGIQAALRHREATGEGQHIDCALLDTAVAILANQGMNHLVGGLNPEPMGNGHPNVVPYRTFAAADGHLIVAAGNDGQFRALCTLLGSTELGTDPAFATNSARLTNRATLEPLLAAAIAQLQSADLLARMEAAGVPGGPINRLDQVFLDPQVQARGMVQTFPRSEGEPLRLTRFPPRLSASPTTIRNLPPALGADGAAVLAELNLAPGVLEDLITRGIVAVPDTTTTGD